MKKKLLNVIYLHCLNFFVFSPTHCESFCLPTGDGKPNGTLSAESQAPHESLDYNQ